MSRSDKSISPRSLLFQPRLADYDNDWHACAAESASNRSYGTAEGRAAKRRRPAARALNNNHNNNNNKLLILYIICSGVRPPRRTGKCKTSCPSPGHISGLISFQFFFSVFFSDFFHPHLESVTLIRPRRWDHIIIIRIPARGALQRGNRGWWHRISRRIRGRRFVQTLPVVRTRAHALVLQELQRGPGRPWP